MKKIYIDTDMGNDDIMAICLLLASEVIDITGISTVYGVSGAQTGALNLAKLLKYLGKNIKIKSGSPQPLFEKTASFPLPDRLRAENLVLSPRLKNIKTTIQRSSQKVEKFISEAIGGEKVIIVALGPLTNIAKYISAQTKNINQKLKIVLMGGGLKRGNVFPDRYAEYNIWLDPEAAEIVFNSGVSITMVGINATDYVLATKEFRQQIESIRPRTKAGAVIRDIILLNNGDFDAYYDPLTAAIVMDESLITSSLRGTVDAALKDKRRGETQFQKNNKGNVNVVMKVNASFFYSRLLQVVRGK
ncbi:nucleoside hydrolase [Candidatus Roizmanbacteria bacterium]|nr:nucleoside hydrolase [Candidatus Roizmanbacteria bacterium]